MQQQMAQQGKKPGGSKPPRRTQVSLIVNRRKNSILAYAPPDKMVIIDQAITALDVRRNGAESPAGFVGRTQVYRLETIDPEPVVKSLEEMGDLDPNTRLEADQENKLIIAYASLIDHATIQLLVNKLDGGGHIGCLRICDSLFVREYCSARRRAAFRWCVTSGLKNNQE